MEGKGAFQPKETASAKALRQDPLLGHQRFLQLKYSEEDSGCG